MIDIIIHKKKISKIIILACLKICVKKSTYILKEREYFLKLVKPTTVGLPLVVLYGQPSR